jgi:hypothetical protein
MARRRPSTRALYSGRYSPKRAMAARTRKATAGPKQRAKIERALKRSQQPSRSPKPGTAAAWARAERMLGPKSSWPAEARHLKDGALYEALGRPGYEGSKELWHEYLDDLYRPAYRAAVTEKARTTRASKPKPKGSWVHVKAHRRHRPGKG